MQQIFGYLGGQDAYTQLNQFTKKAPKETKREKSLLQTNEFHVFEPQIILNNPLTWGNMKLNTVNSGLAFQQLWNTERAVHQPLNTAVATIGDLALVFMGEVDDVEALKADLQTRGHVFENECASEYLVRVIDEIQINEEVSLQDAVRIALKKVDGAYAVLVMSKQTPNNMVAGNVGPNMLSIGLGKNAFYISNVAATLSGLTNKVVYLGENKIASISLGEKLSIKTLLDEPIKPFINRLEWSLNREEYEDKKIHSLKSMATLLGHHPQRKQSPSRLRSLLSQVSMF